MHNIILIGSGGHADSVREVIESSQNFQIAGFVDPNKKIFNNYQYLGNDNDLSEIRKKYNHAVNCIGQIKSAEPRKRIFQLLKGLKFSLPSIKASSSYISDHAQLGESSIAMHGSMINSGVTIGCNCILNSFSLIEHGSIIGDHVHIATGAIINGDAIIEEGCFIGSGAVVIQGIRIGKNSIVGAGRIVKENIPDNTTLL